MGRNELNNQPADGVSALPESPRKRPDAAGSPQHDKAMKDFDKIIWRDALTFVDFFATWCGPCQMMMPVIDKFQEQMNGRVDVYKVDIDDRDLLEIVRRYNVMSVPTLMFFRRGEVLWRESGRVSYDHLVKVLNQLEKREHVNQH